MRTSATPQYQIYTQNLIGPANFIFSLFLFGDKLNIVLFTTFLCAIQLIGSNEASKQKNRMNTNEKGAIEIFQATATTNQMNE